MNKKIKCGGMDNIKEELKEFNELQEKTINILLGMEIDQTLHKMHIKIMEDELKNNKNNKSLKTKLNESKASLVRKEKITNDLKKELDDIKIIIEKKKVLLKK